MRHPTIVVTSTLLLVAASPAAIAATTELVSITSAGQQANGNSYDPSVSADGSRVGFRSVAANLGGDGLTFRVYVRDRLTLQTIAADTGLGGAPPDGDFSVPSCRATAAASCSPRSPPISSPATPTTAPTCSSTTSRPAPPCGSP